ncbi:diacylglycerol kinase [Ghiorsea bivora]|uniref:diacylglycerol kinase n=1 Tax=Ghiorsea bivora TaxID=1485545 RepID=UPI00056DB72C|nr:diacylglycerol kinase [Ghiorsea bivora]
MKPNHHALEHLWYATQWSFAGLKAAWQYEQAFRIEIIASLFIVPLAFYLGEGAIEQVLMLGAWLLVIIVELLNSAIEATVDRIGTEHHELSGRAKDLASAAVSLCGITFIVTWVILLLH